ncbi:RING finger protein, partial [Dictyocoela roeselum]
VLALLLGKFVLLGIWTAYISCIIVVSMSALKRPVKRSTPRKVYLFFQKLLLLIYVAIAVNQVGIVISFFCQINFGIGLFFYLFILSVYLGLLSSEAVRILSGKMATNTGYYSEKGAPTRILRENLCPLCGDEFYDEIKLTCGHSYHAACIKGWSFLAKREFCPMCRENVPIKNLITDKWMRGEIYFSDFLGLMRNFIVVASFIFVLYLCFPWLY